MKQPVEILIAIHGLEPGMRLARDVRIPGNGRLVAKKGTVLSQQIIGRIADCGTNAAYVYDCRQQQVVASLTKEVIRQRISQKSRKKLLIEPAVRREALSGIEHLFDVASDIGAHGVHDGVQVIRQLDKVVGELVDTLQDDPSALVNIQDLKSYDEYTYHHSLSVAVLSLAIGQCMRYGKESLRRLGMCAILHDIGKTAIPIELINKPSRLTDEEFGVVKTHSLAGYNYLMNLDYIDEEILQGVLHHHERVDGAGYPSGLREERIPLMSRIVSVADVYDALTSHRPYRKPMEPGEAIEYVMGNVSRAFDYDITVAFVSKVELYPVGGIVQLSNGQRARILDNEHHNRPLVQLIESNRKLDLFRDFSTYNIVVERLVAK